MENVWKTLELLTKIPVTYLWFIDDKGKVKYGVWYPLRYVII